MIINSFYKKIENIPKIKNLILVLIDSIIFLTNPTISFIFIKNLEEQNILINLVFVSVGLFIFIFTGVYKSILRYSSTAYFYTLVIKIFLIIIFSFAIVWFVIKKKKMVILIIIFFIFFF